MSLIKLCVATELFEDPKKDSRMLPATERKSPKPNKVTPNKTILNWGMKK